jgi:predicted molibdopterin-dependent oxidoreductase YjgC
MDYRCVITTCPYCGCGCQMLLEVCEGKLIGTLPLKTGPMNEGKLCIKGWNAHEFVHSADRLTTPLVRKNGRLRESPWEEALDLAVQGLSGIRDRNGGDSVAFLSSARTTNEENYLAQKICRAGFATNNVDHCARL